MNRVAKTKKIRPQKRAKLAKKVTMKNNTGYMKVLYLQDVESAKMFEEYSKR